MTVEVMETIHNIREADGWVYFTFYGGREFKLTKHNWKILGYPTSEDKLIFIVSTKQ